MSLNPEFKEELISILQNTDLEKFLQELRVNGIISHSVSSDFDTLDHERLSHNLLVRYLVNKIYACVRSKWQRDKFLHVLSEVTKTPFIYTEKEQRSNNTVLYPSTDAGPISVGVKRPCHDNSNIILREIHIPILTDILASCAYKWEEIGIALRLTKNIIEECRQATSNAVRLRNIIQEWLLGCHKDAMPVTLQAIKNVLKSELVGMSSLTENLDVEFKKHGIKKPRLQSIVEAECQCNGVVVSDGRSTLLEVVAHRDSTSYQWMKNGQVLHNDSIHSGVDTDILFIKHARQGIEGEYSCRILCDGEKKMKKINLTVEYSHEKKHLLTKYSFLQEVPNSWPPVGTSTFIELALVRDECNINKEYDYSVRGDMDDILEKKDKIEYGKLFSEYNKGELILVEGRPGCGKTTLTHKLTRDWARGPYILNGAQLVFLVSLRILASTKENSLPAILSIFYDIDSSKTVTDMLEKNSGEGVCFIIDGLDEYQERSVPTNIINKLLNKQYLPLAMVIVASRPVGTAKLRHRTKRRIEVLGFSKHCILNYLKEYDFQSGYKASGLEEYLKLHMNVYHMCYLPVHAAMICYIYDQHRGEIPNTETKIYELFTLLTIKRKLECDGDMRKLSSLRRLEGDIEDCFDKVCRLAFDMTIHSKQAIPQSETETCLSDSSGCDVYSLGLVTIDSTAKLLGYEDLYSYLHLTFQEFLAAFHLSTLKEDEQLQLISDHIEKNEMFIVWKFYCGLMKFDPNSRQLQQIINAKSSTDLYRFQCAFESQQKTVCDSSFQCGRTGTISIKDHRFLSIDFYAIGYAVSNTSVFLTELLLDNCTLTEDGVKTFIKEVGATKLNHIKYFCFSTSGGLEQFEILNDFLKELTSLETLDLANTELEARGINALTSDITLPCLKILKIRMPLCKPIYYYDYSSSMGVLKHLSFNSKVLKEVYYNYIKNEQKTHKKCLLQLLKSFKHFKCELISLNNAPHTILCNLDVNLSMVPSFLQLSTLLLVNCNLEDREIQYLTSIKIDSIIETLRLDFNKLSCKGAAFLSKFLISCTKLLHLSVSCNQIGDQGAKALAGALTLNSTLTELDLQCNVLGDEGAVAIAKAVKDFPPNFHLLIWNINITPNGRAKVLEYRQTTEVKEEKPILSWKYVIVNSPEAITRVVKCCANLLTLNFCDRTIGPYAAEALAKSLKYCINLQAINLSGCSLSYKVLQPLGEGLQNCKKLLAVSFGNNRIQSNDVTKLVRGLKLCLSLKKLELHDNQIKEEGLEAMAYELRKCNLQSLNLYHSNIGKYGAAALTRWLRFGMGLQFFVESDTNPKHEELDHFLLKTLNKRVRSCYGEEQFSGHSWCTSLETLNVAKNNIGSEGAAALAYGLKCCSILRSLNLKGNDIGEDGIVKLADGLKDCNTLEILKLNCNPLEPSGAAAMFLALKNCSYLRILKCSQIKLCPCRDSPESFGHQVLDTQVNMIGITALAQGLSCWSQLEELDIRNNNITSSGAIVLADGLKNANSLETLDLVNNQISADGMAALAESLKVSHLKYLYLGSNSIKEDGVAAVNEVLMHCSMINALDISSNFIGSAGAIELGNGLKYCKYLKALNISSNCIGPDGAKALIEGLKSCVSLHILNLNDNNINTDGTIVLATELKSFTCLEKLALSKNNIGTEGRAAIIDWLLCIHQQSSTVCKSISTGLQELQLAHNNIGSKGAAEITEVLRHCSKLQTLDLEGNCIGSDGAVELARGLRDTSLQELSLKNNQIDSNGALELAKNLKHCFTLQCLDLSENSGSDEYAELTDVLRYCKINTNHGYTSYSLLKEENRIEENRKKKEDRDW